ncbi:MAG: hypothetical protein ACOC16_00820 [Nanoarchaeota archaeon]
MNYKKSNIDPIKYIIILLMTSFIFIIFILALFQMSDLYIDERKIKSQLVLSKIFNGECFGNDFATINENKFNQKNLDNCFKNIDKTILFRVSIEDSEKNKLSKYLYAGDHYDEFALRRNYCNLKKSNILCSKMTYPITYINKNNDYSTNILVVEIISM